MKWLLAGLALVVVVALALAQWVLPAKIESSMNVVLPHETYEISERTRALHNSLFIADLHSDSLLWKRDLLRDSDIGHMDLPRLREGNVALQVFSATTKSPSDQNYESNEANSDTITMLAVASLWPPRTWGSLYERAVFQLEKLHDIADRSELIVIIAGRNSSLLVAKMVLLTARANTSEEMEAEKSFETAGTLGKSVAFSPANL
jgi:hypothetical protein